MLWGTFHCNTHKYQEELAFHGLHARLNIPSKVKKNPEPLNMAKMVHQYNTHKGCEVVMYSCIQIYANLHIICIK